MWTALKWVWHIGWQILYLALTYWILSQLQGHAENVIVPMLGLLYSAIRATAIGNAFANIKWALIIAGMSHEIFKISHSGETMPDESALVREWEGKAQSGQFALIPECFCLVAIDALCLWHLYHALNQ